MKIIEIIADAGHTDTITGIADQHEISDYWMGPELEGVRRAVRMLVPDDKRQAVLDALQSILGSSETARIVVIPVEAILPKPVTDTDKGQEKKTATGLTREELYNNIEKNAQLDSNYVVLVILSTLVVTIGLLENNIAVVIGAMVIAPLLGPNIALALGTALGDTALMTRAMWTNLAGLGLAIILSLGIGAVWPYDFTSPELLSRTQVNMESVALALASGGAAVLSLTTGLPSVLVGVMVAVALLPPATTMGLMLGSGHYALAGGAGLLLAVNIVCVNLAAKFTLLIKGVKPRTWLEKQKARQSMTVYIILWLISLAILIVAIYLRDKLATP